MRLVQVETQAQAQQARELFLEYQKSIGIDLCFQNFDQEVASLPGEYVPPTGKLLLCYQNDSLAGCIALRGIDEQTCEMKRLYVRPAYRGFHLGRTLASTIIGEGRSMGYERMRLDTLPSMVQAISLYESLGFEIIGAYRPNPHPGALYMELPLSPRKP